MTSLQVPSWHTFEPLPLTTRVCPAPDVLVSQVGDELVLLDLGSEQYFGLDPVARSMWDKLMNGNDIETAVDALLEEYEVDRQQLLNDLSNLLEQLASRKLVEFHRVSER